MPVGEVEEFAGFDGVEPVLVAGVEEPVEGAEPPFVGEVVLPDELLLELLGTVDPGVATVVAVEGFEASELLELFDAAFESAGVLGFVEVAVPVAVFGEVEVPEFALPESGDLIAPPLAFTSIRTFPPFPVAP